MKKRLDLALVERGLAETRARAQALVMEGKVRVGGQTETKSSRQVDDGAEIEVEAPPRFVSRGGASTSISAPSSTWRDDLVSVCPPTRTFPSMTSACALARDSARPRSTSARSSLLFTSHP